MVSGIARTVMHRAQWDNLKVTRFLPIPVLLLGLFTSAIQALIFATLAAYYIGEAVEEHD